MVSTFNAPRHVGRVPPAPAAGSVRSAASRCRSASSQADAELSIAAVRPVCHGGKSEPPAPACSAAASSKRPSILC